MTQLITHYLGLELKSPIIVSSCGLTNSVADIRNAELNGAGAVVLKSLFEEEIVAQLSKDMSKMYSENFLYPETMEFYENMDVDDALTSYLKLITDCKKETTIPIIASINCITSYNWPYFAKSLQDAGADAIELNVFTLPSNLTASAGDNESVLFDALTKVKAEVTIPVSVKISHYFSNLGQVIQQLSQRGADGVVLFNRFYSPDIDIENMEIVSSHIFSHEHDYTLPLQWVGLMSGRVDCDLSASTGVHSGSSVIKMILAGAASVQVASSVYKNGMTHIGLMLKELIDWMERNHYQSINEFKGSLSQVNAVNPAGYERLQFMKHFAGK